jgi:hypothetical protein
VNFSGTKIKGYFIFNFTLKYLNFSVFWVSHLWLVTLHLEMDEADVDQLVTSHAEELSIEDFTVLQKSLETRKDEDDETGLCKCKKGSEFKGLERNF